LTTNIHNLNTFVDWLYAQKREVAIWTGNFPLLKKRY
jgi:hypothetical protein